MIPGIVPILSVGFHRRGEDIRDRLVALVAREPGIHPARAARILGMAPNSLHFHVHRLLRSGQLSGNEQGKTVHLFLPMTPEGEQEWRIALADPGARAIAALARRQGGLGIEEASRILGQSRKVVRRHMLRMAAQGLFEREPGHHGKFTATRLLLDASAGGREGRSPDSDIEGDEETSKRPALPDCI